MARSLVISGFGKLRQQDIFDLAVDHIGKTRTQSRTGSAFGGCCYAGTGCNAAPLIREDQRQHADDLAGAWAVMVDEGLAPKRNAEFIEKLQQAHDYADRDNFMPEWKERMTNLAATYKLDTTKLDAIKV